MKIPAITILFFFSFSQILCAKNYCFVNRNISDQIVDSIPYKYSIRTNLVTGMFYSPHIDFEKKISNKFGFGLSAVGRTGGGGGASLSIFYNNPDFLLQGFGVFSDLIYYKKFDLKFSKFFYSTYAFRFGYRYLFKEISNNSQGTTPVQMTRLRQDIVSAFRISCVLPAKKSHLLFSLYFIVGAKTSFYQSENIRIRPFSVPADYPFNGCYVLPEYNAGLEIGFGW